MDKSGISFSNLKNIFSRFLNQNETVSVNEWSSRHQQLNDPRVSFLEHRIAGLEGGKSALAAKSLRNARFSIISNLLEKGENVVTFNSWGLAKEDQAVYNRIGVEIRLSEDGNLDTLRKLVDNRTKLIYLETISRRFINVPDFLKIISFANQLNIPVVTDNTASAGGYLFAPLKLKSHLVLESLEDFLPASSRYKAVITDGGNYDWFGGKFSKLSEEKIKFLNAENGKAEDKDSLPPLSLVDYLRKSNKVYNVYPIPHDPFSLITKLEEIPQKIQKRSENAQKLSVWLKGNKYVLKVNYTGTSTGSSYFEALKYFRFGFGFYLSFTINEERAVVRSFFEELKGHTSFKNRLTFDLNKSEGFLAVPGLEFEEIREHFENAFNRLEENIRHQYLIENPWLEPFQLV